MNGQLAFKIDHLGCRGTGNTCGDHTVFHDASENWFAVKDRV